MEFGLGCGGDLPGSKKEIRYSAGTPGVILTTWSSLMKEVLGSQALVDASAAQPRCARTTTTMKENFQA